MTGNRAHVMLDKCNSGGSTASLGSSPGASFSSSLTVPDYCPAGPSQMAGPVCPIAAAAGQCPNAGGSKLPRSTSPFNIKARVKRRREKRLEKQANLNIGLDDCQNPVYPGPELSPPAATNFTTSATAGHPIKQSQSLCFFNKCFTPNTAFCVSPKLLLILHKGCTSAIACSNSCEMENVNIFRKMFLEVKLNFFADFEPV